MSLYKDFHKKYKNDKVIDRDAIWQSIDNILTTNRGSLPGKPDFGCDLKRYCFEVIDHLTVSDIQSEVRRVLTMYEPRIKVETVDVFSQPEFHKVVIEIKYEYTNVRTSEFETYKVVLRY